MTSRLYEQEQSTNKERRLTFRRIIKICVYIIFFAIVLTSAVLSKLSLFTMINAYKIREQVSSCTSPRPSSLSPLAGSLHPSLASPAAHRHGRAVRPDLRP